jgi:hypothetical protein
MRNRLLFISTQETKNFFPSIAVLSLRENRLTSGVVLGQAFDQIITNRNYNSEFVLEKNLLSLVAQDVRNLKLIKVNLP